MMSFPFWIRMAPAYTVYGEPMSFTAWPPWAVEADATLIQIGKLPNLDQSGKNVLWML